MIFNFETKETLEVSDEQLKRYVDTYLEYAEDYQKDVYKPTLNHFKQWLQTPEAYLFIDEVIKEDFKNKCFSESYFIDLWE